MILEWSLMYFFLSCVLNLAKPNLWCFCPSTSPTSSQFSSRQRYFLQCILAWHRRSSILVIFHQLQSAILCRSHFPADCDGTNNWCLHQCKSMESHHGIINSWIPLSIMVRSRMSNQKKTPREYLFFFVVFSSCQVTSCVLTLDDHSPCILSLFFSLFNSMMIILLSLIFLHSAVGPNPPSNNSTAMRAFVVLGSILTGDPLLLEENEKNKRIPSLP